MIGVWSCFHVNLTFADVEVIDPVIKDVTLNQESDDEEVSTSESEACSVLV